MYIRVMEMKQILNENNYQIQYLDQNNVECYYDKKLKKHFTKTQYFNFMFGKDFMEYAEEMNNNVKWKG